MQCNINRKGRLVRLISGVIFLIAGLIVLIVLDRIILGLSLIAFGGFQLFEAKTAWCVIRAMGIKTRM